MRFVWLGSRHTPAKEPSRNPEVSFANPAGQKEASSHEADP